MGFVDEGPWAYFVNSDGGSGGNDGGNPYEYAGIDFVIVTITGSTPVEGHGQITNIVANSQIETEEMTYDFNGIPQQLTQLVVPIVSGYSTHVYLYGDEDYTCDLANTTTTGGVEIDRSRYFCLLVTGEGTIDIGWTWT